MTTVVVSLSPELLAVGLRTRLMRGWQLEVVDEADQADVVVTDRPWTPAAGRRLWALAHPPAPRDLADALTGGGVGGVILLERDLESWAVAIRTVAGGGTWLDPSDGIAGEVILAAFGDARCGGPLELTLQEFRVIRLLPEGWTNAEIGNALGVATNTVKTHLSNAYRKLSATDRVHAVERARELGLLG